MVISDIIKIIEKRRNDLYSLKKGARKYKELKLEGAINELDMFLRVLEYYRKEEMLDHKGFFPLIDETNGSKKKKVNKEEMRHLIDEMKALMIYKQNVSRKSPDKRVKELEDEIRSICGVYDIYGIDDPNSVDADRRIDAGVA